MNLKVYSVTLLTGYIKKLVEGDIILRNIGVEGEISNFKDHTSGHLYFDLKDKNSVISCMMWSTDRQKMKRLPKNGDKVTLRGRVTIYAPQGKYQLTVSEIEFSDDTGDLYKKFLEIRDRLQKEGLFNDDIKKAVPKHPRKIAVITSPTGAAVRDIIKVMKNRNPGQEMVIYPVLVQGEQSEREVLEALAAVNTRQDIDTIIIARGGGSIEDMWSFNSERLAYAIRSSRIPVVTGIGHDIDHTIADFAADLRCATPSQAAEKTIPNVMNRLDELKELEIAMRRKITERVNTEKRHLLLAEKFIIGRDPRVDLMNARRFVDESEDRLKNALRRHMDLEKTRLKSQHDLIRAFSPYGVLEKGYSIIMDETGRVLRKTAEIDTTDTLRLRVSDGETSIERR